MSGHLPCSEEPCQPSPLVPRRNHPPEEDSTAQSLRVADRPFLATSARALLTSVASRIHAVGKILESPSRVPTSRGRISLMPTLLAAMYCSARPALEILQANMRQKGEALY